MKKIIALVVAILMIAAMAVPAFAKTVSGSDATAEATEVGGTLVVYGSSQEYTVTIPEKVDFNNGTVSEDEATKGLISVTETFKISDYSLAADKTLKITIDSSQSDEYADQTGNKWFLFESGTNTGANDVEYFVTANGAPIGRTGQIAEASTKGEIKEVVVSLVFSTYGTSQVASFTDNISYTATIE